MGGWRLLIPKCMGAVYINQTEGDRIHSLVVEVVSHWWRARDNPQVEHVRNQL